MKTEKNKNKDDSLNNDRENLNLLKLRKECWINACDLLFESKILFENDCYARAFMLAYTSMEEVGKYLIVCDYITGIVSLDELKEAFNSHDIKTAYFHNSLKFKTSGKGGLVDVSSLTMVYDKSKFKGFFQYRNKSTYISYLKDFVPVSPKNEIGKVLAKKMICKVSKEIDFIIFAEDLNETIGSRALFK